MAASSSEQSAANQAAENELSLQNQYAKQGKSAFEQSLSQSTPEAVQGQMKQGQQQALQNYAQLEGSGNLPGSSFSASQDPSQAQSQATENAIVGQRVGQSNQAGAALEGYTASDVAQWLKDLQAKTQLGQIGTFAQESEGTLPLQLQQALSSQSTLGGIGSLLSSVGGLASLYGAVNRPGTTLFGAGPSSGMADWNLNPYIQNLS